MLIDSGLGTYYWVMQWNVPYEKRNCSLKQSGGKQHGAQQLGLQCTSTSLQRPTWPWSCSCSGTCARGRVTRCAPSLSCGTSPSPPSASSAPRGRSRSSFSHFNTESTTRSVTPGSFSLWGLSDNSYACLSVADGILTEDLIATLMYCIMI